MSHASTSLFISSSEIGAKGMAARAGRASRTAAVPDRKLRETGNARAASLSVRDDGGAPRVGSQLGRAGCSADVDVCVASPARVRGATGQKTAAGPGR